MAPDDLVAFVAAIELPLAVGPDGALHPRGCRDHRDDGLTDTVATVAETLERTPCRGTTMFEITLDRIREILDGTIDTRPRWVTAYEPANPTSHGMPIVTAVRALATWHPLVGGGAELGVLPASLVSLALCRDYTVGGVEDPTLAPWVGRCTTEAVLSAFDYVPGELCMIAARARHQAWSPARCATFANVVDHEFHGRVASEDAWEQGATDADIAGAALDYGTELVDAFGDDFEATANAALSITASSGGSIASALDVVAAVAA